MKLFLLFIVLSCKAYSQKPIYDTLNITILDSSSFTTTGYFEADTFDTISFNRFVFEQTRKALKTGRFKMIIPKWYLVKAYNYKTENLKGKLIEENY